MKVMTADGRVLTCSRDGNADLFRHIAGGYGLFGVILEVELKTRHNPPCDLEVELCSEDEYLQKLDEAGADPEVQLAWGRLSPTLNGEVLFHRVREVEDSGEAADAGDGVGIESADNAALAKAILHLSKIGPFALEARWALEKKTRLGKDHPTTSLMDYSSPSVEMLNQYWFHEGKKTDILHEYYVPRDGFEKFIGGLRALQDKHGMSTLNCTLRDVGQDTESALPYAREDSIAFVLYYNQDINAEGNEKHGAFTRELIDLAIDCGGTFYLPYQKHYTDAQLRRAYPNVDEFFEKKRELDPNGVFSNKWFERYAGGA
jgi:FAD/FMN-containing dehydrogenase